jgi:hypothetical protein
VGATASQEIAMANVPVPTDKLLCFVIGPIKEKGTDAHRDAEFLLEMIIRPALETDYTVKRVENLPMLTGSQQILNERRFSPPGIGPGQTVDRGWPN